MAYTAPTLEEFIALFPAFAATTPPQYDAWSAEAVALTEARQDCLAGRMNMATMLLTAHYLTLAGIGTGAESSVAAQGLSGFKSIRSGALSMERADGAGSSGSLSSTSYGARAWALLKPCLTGPFVTATGTIPCGGGYQSGPLPGQ